MNALFTAVCIIANLLISNPTVPAPTNEQHITISDLAISDAMAIRQYVSLSRHNEIDIRGKGINPMAVWKYVRQELGNDEIEAVYISGTFDIGGTRTEIVTLYTQQLMAVEVESNGILLQYDIDQIPAN